MNILLALRDFSEGYGLLTWKRIYYSKFSFSCRHSLYLRETDKHLKPARMGPCKTLKCVAINRRNLGTYWTVLFDQAEKNENVLVSCYSLCLHTMLRQETRCAGQARMEEEEQIHTDHFCSVWQKHLRMLHSNTKLGTVIPFGEGQKGFNHSQF